MKSFLFIVLLIIGGGVFYFQGGGKELLDSYLFPGPLPETIDVQDATFMGDESRNPYAR